MGTRESQAIVPYVILLKNMAESSKKISVALAARIAQTLSGSHPTLDAQFREAGFPGEPPELAHHSKWKTWILRLNDHPELDPYPILGRLLEEFMEIEPEGSDEPIDMFGSRVQSPLQQWREKKSKLEHTLSIHGLKYVPGGRIEPLEQSTPVKSMRNALANTDIEAVNIEFERSLATIESDPAAAITSGCSLLEALFREYLEFRGLPLPKKLTLKPLWADVKKDIGLDPATQTDQDIQKILSGLSSVVDGIASLRTHGGTAHGGGKYRYSMKPRHARLLINSAHTLAAFVLETWMSKAKLAKKAG